MKILIGTILFAVVLSVLLAECQTRTYPKSEELQLRQPPTIENNEQDPMNLPVVNSIDGHHMKAFLTAFEAFKQDDNISLEKRKIENYDIQFRETNQYFFVLLLAKRSQA